MKPSGLAWKGFIHRWRTNAAVVAGIAICTAVLIGALLANDSVRDTLYRTALKRIGEAEYVMELRDRFVGSSFAERLHRSLAGSDSVPLLSLKGYAVAPDGGRRADLIQVLGVTDRFWELAPEGPVSITLGPEEIALNEQLASQLDLVPGDEVLVRVQNVQLMPGDAPLSVGADTSTALRLEVAAVVDERHFGAFSLRANQVLPMNAFVSYDLLSQRMGIEGRANVILIAGKAEHALTAESIVQAARDSWEIADAGLTLTVRDDSVELLSERIFIDSAVEKAARETGAAGILTYFVDRLIREQPAIDGSSIPYSFVSAIEQPLAARFLGDLHGELGADEIVLNRWAADDLGAEVGDTILLEYRIPDERGALSPRRRSFRLRMVVPVSVDAESLLPGFPGISGTENCRDWDPGFSMDVSLIRDTDEEYWDTYGGSPKAFISPQAAKNMWANRFGSLTSFRFDLRRIRSTMDSGVSDSSIVALLSRQLAERIDPAALGFTFVPLRELLLDASGAGVDFGSLFIGLSIFLVASSLLLTALLLSLSILQRRQEHGILVAVGFAPRHVRRIVLIEMLFVAFTGCVLGIPLGIGYNAVILRGLETIWNDAVRTGALEQHVTGASLAGGFAAGLLMSMLVIVLGIRKSTRMQPVRLLAGGDSAPSPVLSPKHRMLRRVLPVALSAAGAIGLLAVGLAGDRTLRLGAFFGTGALLLFSGIASLHLLLAGGRFGGSRLSAWSLGRKSSVRRRVRTVTVTALVASGIFVVIAVGANRQAPATDPHAKKSGTGGFVLFGETAVPILDGDTLRVAGGDLDEVTFAAFRVLEGDDASCLNLNRVQNPQVLGVDPDSLSGRFSFFTTGDERFLSDPWQTLNETTSDGAIPAIADQTVLAWGLGKSVGDDITYVNEHGQSTSLRLVASIENSIFQGNLIISEKHFTEQFPSVAGRRLFLVDASPGDTERVAKTLARTLAPFGIRLTRTAERLREFSSVQNTYLSIFLLLGGLGVLLGTVGLGVVVVRNTLESRSEYGLLAAVGCSRGKIRRIIASEHIVPVVFGSVIGVGSAIVSIQPVMMQTTRPDLGSTAVLLGLLVLCSFLWVWVAARLVTRGDFFAALRGSLRKE